MPDGRTSTATVGRPPADGPTRTIGSRRARVALWCTAAAAFTASALVVSRSELGADWFSDEMWRANFVHSPHWWDLYLSWDTPTPPGFVFLFRALGVVLPTGPTALRIGTLVALVVTLLITLRLLLAIIDRPPRPLPFGGRPAGDHRDRRDSPRRRTSMQLAAFAACLAVPLLSAVGTQRTFVPYFVETAVGAGLLLGSALLGRHRAAWPGLLALVAVAPLVSIGAMFLLPATAVYVLRWAWSEPDASRRTAWSVGALLLAGAEALLVYLVAYRPVAKPTIVDYWAGSVLRGHLGDSGQLAARSAGLLGDGVLGWGRWPWTGGNALLWAVLAASALTGLASLGRRWPALLGFLLSGWLAIAVASIVAGWPVTPERVNLPVFLPLYVATLYGAVRMVSVVARDLVPVTAVASALLIIALWPVNQTPLFGDAFLRGLTPDLSVVGASPAQENLVLTYHFASRWYAEDALVTSSPGGRTFTVVPETYTDQSVYDQERVADLVARLPSGSAVWCVIPFDAGPDNTTRACPVPPGLVPIVDQRGNRSVIRGFRTP